MTEAFTGKTYLDGDKDWDAPKWRTLLDNELVDGEEVDFEKQRQVDYYIAQDEIGLKHPKTGATVKLKDDGSMEMFVNDDTGIRLDPVANAILFYGDVIHTVSKEMNIHTKPHGFSWNGHSLNPALQYEDEKIAFPSFKAENGTDYKLFSPKKRPSLYDSKVQELLNNLGIEVEKR